MKKYLVLIPIAFSFFIAAQVHAAPAVVQGTYNSAFPGGVHLSLSGVTSGDTIVAAAANGNASDTISISGTGCGTWTQLLTNATSTGLVWDVWMATSTGGTCIATTTPSVSNNTTLFALTELSGVNGTDTVPVALKNAFCSSCKTATTTPVTNGDLLLDINFDGSMFQSFSSSTNGFTIFNQGTSTSAGQQNTAYSTIYLVQTTAAAVSAGYHITTSSSDAVDVIVAFKAAASPPPHTTSASTTINGNGAKSGDTITITGTNFGIAATSSFANCNGGISTGCVEFIVGGTTTVASASISSWTNTAITFSVSSTLATNGGTSSLQVWAAGASDTTPYTFYIYPNITSISSLGTNAGRTYNASDTDGFVMLGGNHFGTSGTSSILGVLATQFSGATSSECSVTGYTSTSVCLEIPSTIASSTYAGNIILTRSSDNAQASTTLNFGANAFSILPRITSMNPTSTYAGQVVQILGDHLCEPSGTCPSATTSTTNKVSFGSATSTTFVNQTGGAGACNGSGTAWAQGEICVQVPAAAPVSTLSTVVTSNANTSNSFSFTVTTPPVPGTPGTPTYSSVSSSTLTLSWSSASGVVSYYTAQRSTSGQMTSPTTLATTTATSEGDSGLTTNTTYYYQVEATNAGGTSSWSASSSALTVPGVPGTPSYSAVSTSTLTVSWTAPANGATYYVIQRATSSQVYAQVATTTAITYNDSGLTKSVTYYYDILGANATGNGSASASSSVTTSANAPPNAPTENSPSASAQGIGTKPTFTMTGTDPESNNIQYKVSLYSGSSCSGSATTYSENSSQTGWSGQNASSGNEYSSGTQGSYTVQSGSALATSTVYSWIATAIDPEGSNSWGASSTCASFTTTSGNWTVDSGNWSLSGNNLVVTPASGSTVQLRATAAGSTITNAVVEFQAESSSGSAGVVSGIVRADSGSNRYHVTGGNFAAQNELIGKLISGTYSTLVTSAVTLNSGTFYKFRGSNSGTTLASWVGGASVLSTTDSGLSSGYVGLAASSTTGGVTLTFHDFAVYASTIVTMNNLPAGGSWAIENHAGTNISVSGTSCWTVSTIDLSTYNGQVPVDYDNGGGSVEVWNNATCNGAPAQSISASSLGDGIFGGDTYTYTAGVPGPAIGTPIATSTITLSSLGAVND